MATYTARTTKWWPWWWR